MANFNGKAEWTQKADWIQKGMDRIHELSHDLTPSRFQGFMKQNDISGEPMSADAIMYKFMSGPDTRCTFQTDDRMFVMSCQGWMMNSNLKNITATAHHETDKLWRIDAIKKDKPVFQYECERDPDEQHRSKIGEVCDGKYHNYTFETHNEVFVSQLRDMWPTLDFDITGRQQLHWEGGNLSFRVIVTKKPVRLPAGYITIDDPHLSGPSLERFRCEWDKMMSGAIWRETKPTIQDPFITALEDALNQQP